MEYAKPKLSDYGFFTHPMKNQEPVTGIFPYSIATELFSDYAEKLRFIHVPANTTITIQGDNSLLFPEGTVLIKTFYYFVDNRQPELGRRLIETRILMSTIDGWVAFPYVWNEDQSDAVLAIAGDRMQVDWINDRGFSMDVLYSVPNVNQCKGCHVYENELKPIGPKIRNLNMDYMYSDGSMNQLIKWESYGLLNSLPPISSLPRTANANNHHESLNDRARAWMDINCAHCHRQGGPAETSGLFLELEQKNLRALGVMKPPIAAGRGTSKFKYTIVPGEPEKSIMLYRIQSTDPGIMMPELGRRLTHTEGANLVREWIRLMPLSGM
jgi:uncharacterized repeat protein (TIGR03806 family)